MAPGAFRKSGFTSQVVLSRLPSHGEADNSCHNGLPGHTDPKATEPGDHDGRLNREREQTPPP